MRCGGTDVREICQEAQHFPHKMITPSLWKGRQTLPAAAATGVSVCACVCAGAMGCWVPPNVQTRTLISSPNVPSPPFLSPFMNESSVYVCVFVRVPVCLCVCICACVFVFVCASVVCLSLSLSLTFQISYPAGHLACTRTKLLERPNDLRQPLIPVKKDDLDAVKKPLLAAEYTGMYAPRMLARSLLPSTLTNHAQTHNNNCTIA